MTEAWIKQAHDAASRPPPDKRERPRYEAVPVDANDLPDIAERLNVIDALLEDIQAVLAARPPKKNRMVTR